MGWTTEGSEFESRYGQEVSNLHVTQTGYGVHPTSYPMGTGGKAPGLEPEQSPPTNAEVKQM
jgi:hypothetical protein